MKWNAYRRKGQPDNPQAAVRLRVAFHITFEDIVEHLVGQIISLQWTLDKLPQSKKKLEEEIRSELRTGGSFAVRLENGWEGKVDEASAALPSVIAHVKKLYPELKDVKYEGEIDYPEDEGGAA